MEWNRTQRVSLNVTHHTWANCSSSCHASTHHTLTRAKYYSLQCVWKRLHTGCAVMCLQFATKTVCDFPVTLASGASCTLRLAHIEMPTHTLKEHKHMHAQTLAHRHPHTHSHQRTQQALGAMPWPLVPSQRGAVHQYTTAPLIPCVPLVNFALSPLGSEESCVVLWKGGGGAARQENSGVKPLSVCDC